MSLLLVAGRLTGPYAPGGVGTPPNNVNPPIITQNVPSNTAVPTISGTATHGQVLTAATGSWNNEPTGYAYQWQTSPNGTTGWANLPGATASTYTAQVADETHYLRVQVTASNATGAGVPANSAATAQVT